jgi:hypothetical protein
LASRITSSSSPSTPSSRGGTAGRDQLLLRVHHRPRLCATDAARGVGARGCEPDLERIGRGHSREPERNRGDLEIGNLLAGSALAEHAVEAAEASHAHDPFIARGGRKEREQHQQGDRDDPGINIRDAAIEHEVADGGGNQVDIRSLQPDDLTLTHRGRNREAHNRSEQAIGFTVAQGEKTHFLIFGGRARRSFLRRREYPVAVPSAMRLSLDDRLGSRILRWKNSWQHVGLKWS